MEAYQAGLPAQPPLQLPGQPPIYSDAVVQAEYAPATPSSGKGWITLIIVLTITLVVIGILWLCWQSSRIFGGRGGTLGGNTTTGSPPACSSVVQGLPTASSQCCIPAAPGDSASTRFLQQQQLFIDPAPPPSYQTVCSQFCAPGSNYNTSNDTCSLYLNNSSASFDTCIALLKPTNCTGAAKPVAIGTDGATLFYAQAYAPNGCNLQTCPAGT